MLSVVTIGLTACNAVAVSYATGMLLGGGGRGVAGSLALSLTIAQAATILGMMSAGCSIAYIPWVRRRVSSMVLDLCLRRLSRMQIITEAMTPAFNDAMANMPNVAATSVNAPIDTCRAVRNVLRQCAGEAAARDDTQCPLCHEPLCSDDLVVGVHATEDGRVRVTLAQRAVFRCGRCRGAMHADCACAMLCVSTSLRKCLHCTAAF